VSDNLPEGVNLYELDADAFIAELDTIISIYEEAKGVPANRPMMERHASRPGFRCVVAKHDGAIIGFIYGMRDGRGTGLGIPGFPSSRGTHDLIDRAIAAGLLSSRWAEAFDLAEVHVRKAWQEKGIGGKLIRALCTGLSAAKVALIVEVTSRARKLYQRFGFDDLPTPESKVYLMGRSLPLPPDPRCQAQESEAAE
jgi:ribosomal protein S18 acetylase RimI-like enzyme